MAVRTRRILGALLALALATCDSATSTSPPPPGGLDRVRVSAPTKGAGWLGGLREDDTVRLLAEPLDRAGQIVPGLRIIWRSNDTSLVSVDSTGLVTGRQVGSTGVQAYVGGLTDGLFITVTDSAKVRVRVTPSSPTVLLGGALTLTATERDSLGNVLALPITWTVSDPSAVTLSAANGASVTVTGTALAASVTVTASVLGSQQGYALVTVAPAGAPSITGVAPAPVRAGGIAVITGTNFDLALSHDTVRIDGTPAVVTGASATQLTVRVSLAVACSAPRDVAVMVIIGARSATLAAPLDPTRTVVLGAGESVFFDSSATAGDCVTLAPAPGARYLLGVYHVGNERGTPDGFGGAPPLGFLLSGNVSPALASRVPVARPAVRPPAGGTASRDPHMRVLERNLRLLAERAPPGTLALRTRRRFPAPPAFAPRVGDVLALTVPDIDHDNDCTRGIPIKARVAYVGPKALVLEDRSNPFAGLLDDDLRLIGAEFDAMAYGEVTTNFGDPLAIDPQLGNKGRVLMLFSRRVNRFYHSGLLGFVYSCDLFRLDSTGRYPNTISNEAAIFYGISPSTRDSLSWWRGWMRGIIPHETKHIASFAAKLSLGEGYEESWLEEATAQVSAEIYARNFTGQSWKGHGQWNNTVGCEPPANLCGGDVPRLVQHNFRFLYDYLDSLPRETPAGDDNSAKYGGAWSLVRWIVDQYAASESQMLRDITHASVSGAANLALQAGVPYPQLASRWAMASALPAYPVTPVDPRLTLPSWDQASIYQGMRTIFPTRQLPYPLVPIVLAPDGFSVTGVVRGGGMTIFDLSAPQPFSRPIALANPDGSALPAGSQLRLAIVRVQ